MLTMVLYFLAGRFEVEQYGQLQEVWRFLETGGFV